MQPPACSRASVKVGAGCSGLCPVKAWTSSKTKTPGSLWAPALLFHHLIMKFLLLLSRRQFVVPDLWSQALILPLGTSVKSLTPPFLQQLIRKLKAAIKSPVHPAWSSGCTSPAPSLSQPAPDHLAQPPRGSLQFLNNYPVPGSPKLKDSKCSLTTTTLSSNMRNLN